MVVLFTVASVGAGCPICEDVYANFEKTAALLKADKSASKVHFGVILHDPRNAKVFEAIEIKTTPAMVVFNFPPIKQKQLLKGNIYFMNSDIDYSVGALLSFLNNRLSLAIKERMNTKDSIIITLLLGALCAAFVYLLKHKDSLIDTFETLQGYVKKREIWLMVSGCVFVIFMGGVVFSTLHGAPLYVPNSDIIEMFVNKQNRYQYGLEGFIASARFTHHN